MEKRAVIADGLSNRAKRSATLAGCGRMQEDRPRKRRHRHPRLEFCVVLLPLYAHVLPLWSR
jgi:hypothetical protein